MVEGGAERQKLITEDIAHLKANLEREKREPGLIRRSPPIPQELVDRDIAGLKERMRREKAERAQGERGQKATPPADARPEVKPDKKGPGILTRVGEKINIDRRKHYVKTHQEAFAAHEKSRADKAEKKALRDERIMAKISERHRDAADRARAFEAERATQAPADTKEERRRGLREALDAILLKRREPQMSEYQREAAARAEAENQRWEDVLKEETIKRDQAAEVARAEAAKRNEEGSRRRSISGSARGKLPPMFGTQPPPEPLPGTRGSYAANSERMRDAAERARAENERFENLLQEDKKRREQQGSAESGLDRLGKRLMESFTKWRTKEAVKQSPPQESAATPPTPREVPDEGFTWHPSSPERRKAGENREARYWAEGAIDTSDKARRKRALFRATEMVKVGTVSEARRRGLEKRILAIGKEKYASAEAYDKRMTPAKKTAIALLALAVGIGGTAAAAGYTANVELIPYVLRAFGAHLSGLLSGYLAQKNLQKQNYGLLERQATASLVWLVTTVATWSISGEVQSAFVKN